MCSTSAHIDSVYICLAYNTVCAVPCGAVMLSNGSPRHSLTEERAAFHRALKPHLPLLTLYFILLKYPDTVTPYIAAEGGRYIIEILMDESSAFPLSCSQLT